MKKIILWGLAALALPVVLFACWALFALRDLPDVSVLKSYRPPAASEVLDRNGVLIAHYYDHKFRVWVPIASLPDRVIQEVVTAEDDTFFGHQGVNYQAVWEALKHDVGKKRFARGGSTITQQMIKNVLLSKEKTLARKLREFVLARRAEELLSKRRILEIYLNEVEWGENIHGIEAAARFYFDKHASELSNAEAALLAGMLPNPKYYNPYKRLDKALKRREQVLFNMFQAKLLTEEEYGGAMDEPVRLRDASSRRFDLSMLGEGNRRPCHLLALEQILLAMYGEQTLYRSGVKVRTTLDRSLQESLSALVSSGGVSVFSVPDRVLTVREGPEIRALACAGNEEAARSFLASFGNPDRSFEIATMALESLTKEMIAVREGGLTEQAPPGENLRPVRGETGASEKSGREVKTTD